MGRALKWTAEQKPPLVLSAATFAAWGHRKLWALLQADGCHVSMSSVASALGRRGLLLPQRHQAERRQLARARRPCFLIRRRAAAASGSWTSVSSRRPAAASGGSPVSLTASRRSRRAVKYEHVYREEIEDGLMVARAVERYLALHNTVRPHEAIGLRAPLAVWRDFDDPPVANQFTPLTVSLS
jgi:hypothetical protein